MAMSRWQNVDDPFAAAPDEAAFWTGRTFDDFLFRPQKTDSHTRRTISVKSLLTADVALDLPIVSSNMDSVTGADMARAMAMHGGIGVVHRGMSIERQAAEVAVVKRSQSAVIDRPLCLPMGTTIRQARRFARQHGITGILIETASGSNVLAGLLSNRDTPVPDADEDRAVDEFMTPLSRLVTGAPDISTDEAERLMFEHRIERLPLIDGANHIQGLITRRDINLKRKQPGASKDGASRRRRRGERNEWLHGRPAFGHDLPVVCVLREIGQDSKQTPRSRAPSHWDLTSQTTLCALSLAKSTATSAMSSRSMNRSGRLPNALWPARNRLSLARCPQSLA